MSFGGFDLQQTLENSFNPSVNKEKPREALRDTQVQKVTTPSGLLGTAGGPELEQRDRLRESQTETQNIDPSILNLILGPGGADKFSQIQKNSSPLLRIAGAEPRKKTKSGSRKFTSGEAEGFAKSLLTKMLGG